MLKRRKFGDWARYAETSQCPPLLARFEVFRSVRMRRNILCPKTGDCALEVRGRSTIWNYYVCQTPFFGGWPLGSFALVEFGFGPAACGGPF
jgi:hypothetical protein